MSAERGIVRDGRSCRGCKRGRPCDPCAGEGCGGCVRTGFHHYFNEVLEHIAELTPEDADATRDRIVERLR